MKLSELGEFGFIEQVIQQQFEALNKADQQGIGDDCAVLSGGPGRKLLVSTDLLVEGTHFLRDKITAAELGYKSLAVNLSDLAAMGARPVASFLSLGLTADVETQWAEDFFKGYYDLSHQSGCALLGGDTTKSAQHLVINVAVIGEAREEEIKYRHTACEGDFIYHSGCIGDSPLGLKLLLEQKDITAHEQPLLKQHHMPQPQLAKGMWLAKRPEVHAMMDISDGLSSDLHHILKRSNKSAVVHLDQITTSELFREVCQKHSYNAAEIAVSGGEDYQLLFTVAANQAAEFEKAYQQQFGESIKAAGRIGAGPANIEYRINNKTTQLANIGWRHF